METLKKQQLEVLSISNTCCFLFMGPFFSHLVFFLLGTSLWGFSVLYLVWLFLDRDILHQGLGSTNLQSLDFILSQPQLGQAVHSGRESPRGPACHIREHYFTRWNRKGFVRLALRYR